VLRLLMQERSDKDIADTHYVTRRSACKHVSTALGKLGVSTRTAATALVLHETDV
jgi:DNA-binding NarL/FixJ family response regulator